MTETATIIAINEMASKLSLEMIDMAIDILESQKRIKKHALNQKRLENGETLAEVFYPDSYQAKIDRENREDAETKELLADDHRADAEWEARELSSQSVDE